MPFVIQRVTVSPTLLLITGASALVSMACGLTEQSTNLRSSSSLMSSDQRELTPSQDDDIVPSPPVSVDLKVDGKDGPVYVAVGTEIELSWTSSGAAFCTGPSSFLLNDKKNIVVTVRQTFSISCMNGEGTSVDSVVVEIGEQPVERRDDLAYCPATTGGLKLDMALPLQTQVGTATRPLLVLLHGGTNVSLSRKTMSPLLNAAARRGFVAAAIDYRLTGDLFPQQVEEVKCAIRWLRSQAADLGLDPQRVGLMGHSTGAHLALLAAYSNDDQFKSAEIPGETSRVQAVVNWAGATDLAALYADSGPPARARMSQDYGGTPEQMPAAYEQASPVFHASSDDPPTHTTHGMTDTTVPLSQAVALDTRAKAVALEHTLVRLPGEGHVLIGDALDQATTAALDFFAAKLAP